MDWRELLRKPAGLDAHGRAGKWFDAVAAVLLGRARLVAGGTAFRIVEAEFYLFSDDHPDPSTHRDPLQKTLGRWYFHRSGGAYRSGSFKGLDLTFGDGSAFGGILLRGLEAGGGGLVDGPSLLVDRLLSATGRATVAELDAALGTREAWDPASPLRLEHGPADKADPAGPPPLYRTARVGLTLKRSAGRMAEFLMRPYRFLSEPRRTAKGKPYLVLSLHARGLPPDEIAALTGCPRKTVDRYAAWFEAGRAEGNPSRFAGSDLNPEALCRLHGAWWAAYGGSGDDVR
jgi:hypothetical protein